MGRKQIVTTTRETRNDDEEKEREVVESLPTEQELTWAAFKGKFSINQGAKVKVYRQTPRGRQYCFFGTPAEIDEESIRVFHCKQPNAHEATDYYLALEIDGVLQEPFCVPIAPQVATPGADIQTDGMHGGMAAIVRLVERLEQRLMEREHTPMGEMVDAMYKLDQMRGGGQKEMSTDTILKCIEIGQKLNGSPQAADGWSMLLEVAKENAPALLGIASRMMRPADPQAGPPVQALPEQPIESRRPGEMTEEQMKQANEHQERMLLVQTVAYLKKKALAGSDPGLYVDLVLDNREDPVYARLLSEVADKDFSTFAAIDPDIEKPQYRPFFAFIYDGLRSFTLQTNPVGAAASGKGGNAGHAAGNGAAGKGRKQ